MTTTALPGEWVNHAPGLDDMAGTYRTRISTDRYRSREYAEREREAIWMKTWQMAGRVEDLGEEERVTERLHGTGPRVRSRPCPSWAE